MSNILTPQRLSNPFFWAFALVVLTALMAIAVMPVAYVLHEWVHPVIAKCFALALAMANLPANYLNSLIEAS